MARKASGTKRGGGRSQSSQRWLREHDRDPWVRRARVEGYRGRAVYKLMELDRKDGLFRKGMRVVDLGAAPGSWSQYAVEQVGVAGRVVASDILPMEPIDGAVFVQADFREQAGLDAIRAALGADRADIVLSDMAPNMSGIDAVDQPASMVLTELAHALAVEVLQPEGALVTKLFQGEGSDAFIRHLRRDFRQVRIRKPEASRPRSREVYAVAIGRHL